ncbi:MAG TPA: hypothetical protein VJR87_09600 [Allosphingosinicella sp.]|nr:hypothetical protein [Allosphingosinicella sp.]
MLRRFVSGFLARTFAVLAALAAVPAVAQPAAEPAPVAAPPLPVPRVQTAIEALAQDAAEYARDNDVPLDEAMRRLRAQEESVPATDRIAALYRHRLAGIAIEHHPDYRIVVLLAGDEPVADETVAAGGMQVPIVFRTGAKATRDRILAAIATHQARIRAAMPSAGMGLDPRSGALVVIVKGSDADRYGRTDMTERIEALTGVPVEVRIFDETPADFSLGGGVRVTGIDKYSGRRRACTAGFVVTDASRTGIATAAHCPDTLVYDDPESGAIALDFVGEWGARYQDVQVNVADRPLQPLFTADAANGRTRRLTSWRNRASTRAGDAVCHHGERTGYSCSLVELVDFAPPGDLCGGPCDPTWVTVAGPHCKSGDSGGPVFNGTVAFGLLKGGDYKRDGGCAFYFYMSTDYLPPGWLLLHG